MRGTKFFGIGVTLVALMTLLLICNITAAQIIPGRYIVVFRDDVVAPPAAADAIKIKIVNPKEGENFGIVSLNGEIVEMENLAEKFQNALNKFETTLIIQSEWNVPHEQIVQIMDIAKRCGFDKIGFTAEEAPVKLQQKPLLGEELTYRMEVTTQTTFPTGEVVTAKSEGQITSICVQVDDEGVKTDVAMIRFGLPETKWEKVSQERLKMFEEALKSKKAEQMSSAIGRQLVITRSRPDGTVLSETLSPMALMGGGEMTDLMAKLQRPGFPDKPIKIGDSWTKEVEGLSFKGTLLGFEEVQGYKCAKIQLEATVKTPPVEGTSQSTAFLVIEEGFYVKSVTKTKSKMAMGDMTMSHTMELTKRYKLSPDELKKAQEEVAELEIGFAHLKKQEQDAAKEAFQQFLEAHPESRFREGVEGLIAQKDIVEKAQAEPYKRAGFSRLFRKAAPDFALKDLSGGIVKLSDLKGKVTLLSFWSKEHIWSSREIPHFTALYDEYQKEGFEMVGISIDQSAEEVQKFVEEHKVNYPILMASDLALEAYGVNVPISFLLDKKNVIRKIYFIYHDKSVFEADIRTLLAGEPIELFKPPPSVLRTPNEEQIEECKRNLGKIGQAIAKYREEHGDIPNWLSDLYPKYIQDANILLCPADTSKPKGSRNNTGAHIAPYTQDPKMPCSYLYEFSPLKGGMSEDRSWKEWKTSQMKEFGDKVPIVRCWWHGGDRVMNLSYGGEVYESSINWEYDLKGK